MPSIKNTNQVTAENALTGNLFAKLKRPALISLMAAGVTNSDTIGMSIGDREILRNANPNIEISADVVDASRDGILFAEPAEQGQEVSMPVTVTTATNFLVVIDEL